MDIDCGAHAIRRGGELSRTVLPAHCPPAALSKLRHPPSGRDIVSPTHATIVAMKIAGLFAGSGAFEHAFATEGFDPCLLVENDPAAQAVLRKQFPDVAIENDIRELTRLPSNIGVVTAGFPCQNLSLVGDKSGIQGNKSKIVETMFPLIAASNVRTVIVENVSFMLRLSSGSAMRWLVDRFEDRGFKWAYRVLDTMGFGLPQRRKRVYLVATRDLDPRTILFADEGTPPLKLVPTLQRPLGFYWTEGRTGVGFTVDGIPPIKAGSTVGIPSPPAVLFQDGQVLRPSITACERLQGMPVDWTNTNSDAQSQRARWRLVGNAVSRPVARWVASRIKNPGTIGTFRRANLRGNHRWPDAAWNIGTGRIGVDACDHPLDIQPMSISHFLDASWHALSDRALTGFIHRARSGSLKMPSGFLSALTQAKSR